MQGILGKPDSLLCSVAQCGTDASALKILMNIETAQITGVINVGKADDHTIDLRNKSVAFKKIRIPLRKIRVPSAQASSC